MDTREALDAIDDDLVSERTTAAGEKLTAIGALDALPSEDRARAEVLRLRISAMSGGSFDRIAIDARRALKWAPEGMPHALLHAEVAYALTAKRCKVLAAAAAERAISSASSSSVGYSVHGWIGLRFDDRAGARAAYEEAAKREDPWRGHLGLARLAYVEGDFEKTLTELEGLKGQATTRIRALRIRADVARVRGDWSRFLALKEEILEATTGGAWARSDRLDRAGALFALDRRDDGLEAYRALWRDDENDGVGRFAREVLNTVERKVDGTSASRRGQDLSARPRVMLKSFPTVTQKRNYCGPATLELVVRSLGIDATQDTIAPIVKGEFGSAIFDMTRYLESQELEARRFEGDGAKLRACIELGLPVIVEEEYSTTNHVAVVIGVDEELGLLFVQDPMTHVTEQRLLKTQGYLGALFRNAAIVAFKKGDEEKAKALDAAGIVDAEHLRLVDSCGAKDVEDDLEEVLRRCSRAIALCDDYPLAWQRKTRVLYAQMNRMRTRTNIARFLRGLREARVKYGQQEWPHQVHGDYLNDESRSEEALIEYEEALRQDPGDSNNAQHIAECHMALDRTADATAAFWKALTIDPGHSRATENFASHALDNDDLELAAHLAPCALEMAPGNPFNHVTASRVASAEKRTEDAIAHARKSVEIAPEYSHGKLRLAQLLRDSEWEEKRKEALALYLSMVESSPQWFQPRTRAASLMQAQGQAEEACQLLIDGIEIAQDEPVDLVRVLTEIECEEGYPERAVDHAERFARERPTVGMRGHLWEILAQADREARGVELTREFLEESPDSPYACAEHSSWLIGGDDVEAEKLLRNAVEGSPTYDYARKTLATLLSHDRHQEAVDLLAHTPSPTSNLLIETARIENERGEFAAARAALAKALELDADVTFGYQAEHNHALLADAPEVVLERLIKEDSENLIDLRARVCFASALGRKEDALAALARIPLDDGTTRSIVGHAADGNDAFRPAVEERYSAFASAPTTPYASKRWATAILLGNRAATGDRTGLETYVTSERNPYRVGNALTTLSAIRQRDLVLLVRKAIGEREPTSAMILGERMHVAAAEGDHDGAIAIARECLATWPRARSIVSLLAAELLFLGKDQEALVEARRAARMTSNWAMEDGVAAAAALIGGHREEAVHRCERARRRILSCGYSPDEYTLLKAASAVLAGDRAALDAARRVRGIHFDPESPLWTKLAAKISS